MARSLHIKDLKPGYGSKEVLHIEKAELLDRGLTALIGRNGSGKSTLLRTLAGLILPVSGKIFLGDVELPHQSNSSRAKMIASVFHGGGSGMGMTVFEMIALGRSPHTNWWGSLSDEDYKIIEHSAEMTGVSGMLDKRISETSDGERQKCLIARALAQDTPILLLDEPLAFLDFQAKQEMLALMRKLCNSGKSILFSTHDLELSLPHCDHIWTIDEQSQFSDIQRKNNDAWKEEINALFTYILT